MDKGLLCKTYRSVDTVIYLSASGWLIIKQIKSDQHKADVISIDPQYIPKMMKMLEEIYSEYESHSEYLSEQQKKEV